jgi:enoyl-CoA hydratase
MARYPEFIHLESEVADGIATITFAPVPDPDMDHSFFADLRDVFVPLSRDKDVRAVVFTGRGDRFVPALPKSSMELLVGAPLEERAARLLTVQQFAAQLLSFRKPVVAAVNGGFTGGIGIQLAFLSDAAVADSTVTFGDTHVGHGLTAGDGGTMAWPVLVGVARAREILIRGQVLTAQEALDMHLVAKVVEPGHSVAAAKEMANQLADLPALPFLATKLALNNTFRSSALVSWDLAAAYEAAGLSTRKFAGEVHAQHS